jgi:predicted acyltransferase (DUF342 family)
MISIDNVMEDTRADIRGKFSGSILPTKEIQIKRDVYLANGATVSGSVYGRDVSISDNVRINGCVLSNRHIIFDLNSSTEVTLLKSAVYSRESILVKQDDKNKNKKPLLQIDGDILSKQIHLKNAIVKGSILGHDLILENCIVYGLIISTTGSITLENTLAYAIYGGSNVKIKKSKLILPFIFSKRGEIKVEDNIPILIAGDDGPEIDLKPSDVSTDNNGCCAELFWRTLNISNLNEKMESALNSHLKTTFDKLST